MAKVAAVANQLDKTLRAMCHTRSFKIQLPCDIRTNRPQPFLFERDSLRTGYPMVAALYFREWRPGSILVYDFRPIFICFDPLVSTYD